MTPGLGTSAGSPTFYSTPMGGESLSNSSNTPLSATAGQQQQPFMPVPIYNMQGLITTQLAFISHLNDFIINDHG